MIEHALRGGAEQNGRVTGGPPSPATCPVRSSDWTVGREGVPRSAQWSIGLGEATAGARDPVRQMSEPDFAEDAARNGEVGVGPGSMASVDLEAPKLARTRGTLTGSPRSPIACSDAGRACVKRACKGRSTEVAHTTSGTVRTGTGRARLNRRVTSQPTRSTTTAKRPNPIRSNSINSIWNEMPPGADSPQRVMIANVPALMHIAMAGARRTQMSARLSSCSVSTDQERACCTAEPSPPGRTKHAALAPRC